MRAFQFYQKGSYYNFNQMSTLEPKTQGTMNLPKFKSTSMMHQMHRKNLTPRKMKSNLSSFLTPYEKHSVQIDTHITSSKAFLQTTLPEISSKKSVQKRSSFLQMWLDEALDPQDRQGSVQTPQLRVDVDKTGPLKTVQKFNIDKKFLRSQNISQEGIEKIYNSLYIYTYGINAAFSDVVSLTKNNEHVQSKIIENFWRAFIKLLEGCTSFQTTFQVVEEKLHRSIGELKDTFLEREKGWIKEKAELEEQNLKMLRRINELSSSLTKLTTDYNISEATLQLTDCAFNDEVHIRLKFEEKVNQMFGSYEELREKYDMVLEQFRLNKDIELQGTNKEKKYKVEIQHLQLKVEQLKKSIQRSNQIIEERNQQLTIKRQQIFDLAGEKLLQKEKKQDSEDEVKKILDNMKNYKQLSDEYKVENKSKKLIITELEKKIEVMEGQINSYREKQTFLYSKLHEKGQLIANSEKQIIQNHLLVDDLQIALRIAKQQIRKFDANNEQLLEQRDLLQTELTETKRDLDIKNSVIEKNSQLIQELKGINAKIESLYKSVTKQKKRFEKQMLESAEIASKFQEEMSGMKMLLDNRSTEISESQQKLENEREVFRLKIAALKEDIEVRDQKVLQFHNQLTEAKIVVNEAKDSLKVQEKLTKNLQIKILNLEAERSQKKIQFDSLMQQMKYSGKTQEQLSAQLEETKQQSILFKQKLQLQQSVINAAKELSRQQGIELRTLLEDYREERQKKVSFIHPMLYEDCLEQIDRLTLRKRQLTKLVDKKTQQNQTFINSLEEKTKQNDENFNNYQETLRKFIESEQNLNKLKQKMVENEKILLLKQDDVKIMQVKTNEKIHTLQQKVKVLSESKCQLEDQVQNNLSTINKHLEIISQYQKDEETIKMENSKFEGQIQHLKKQIKNLKEDHEKLKNSQLQEQTKKKQLEQSKNKLSEKEQTLKTEHKANTIDASVQTEKKFSHASKFEIPPSTPPLEQNSFGCQVTPQKIEQQKKRQKSRVPQREHDARRVDANEYKRALKMTYMRR